MSEEIKYNTYPIPASGDVIKRRILEPTTDDLDGGNDVWVLQCGDSKINIDNINSLLESDEPVSGTDQTA